MIVFRQSCCIRAKWLKPTKVDEFGQYGCNRPNWLYSSKSECIWARFFVMGQSGCNRAKVVLFGQSGCIRTKVIVFGQGGCIWEMWLLSGES